MLDDEAIARYARQIVVPGIGAAGQEKLLKSTVLVVGHPRGCATAKLYLEAAGVRVVTALDQARAADVAVVCESSMLDEGTRDSIRGLGVGVCWYKSRSGGFVCGFDPDSSAFQNPCATDDDTNAHDAAACAVASTACAIVLGLPLSAIPIHFSVSE